MKYKTKKTLKTLALSVLGIGAIVGACAGINALVEKQDTELKTIIPMFEVGGLKDIDGKYEDTEKTIYTKQAFECKGLEITLDFDNTINYQVFYYEDDGDFISATEVIGDNQDLVVPDMATHARLEITPKWSEMGEDYKKVEDQKIKWYEVSKYANQINVKVNKEQVVLLSFGLTGYSEEYQDFGDEVTVFYEPGMTWGEWVNSEYNTLGITDELMIPQMEGYYLCYGVYENEEWVKNVYMKSSDIIDNKLNYTFSCD